MLFDFSCWHICSFCSSTATKQAHHKQHYTCSKPPALVLEMHFKYCFGSGTTSNYYTKPNHIDLLTKSAGISSFRKSDGSDENIFSELNKHVRRLLGTHQWQSALLVVGLLVTHDWFEMGCHLSPSLISIRLTA